MEHLLGWQALKKVINAVDVKTVLDVGSGEGHHAEYLRRAGKEVFTISMKAPADYVGAFNWHFRDQNVKKQWDCIWMCHVLEHALDVNSMLSVANDLLRKDGILAITVPPAKTEVVGGHVNLFVPGTLIYNVVMARIDCAKAQISPLYIGKFKFPYNISLVVRKHRIELPEDLEYDAGDIEKLAKYFPLPVHQNFDGTMPDGVNWGEEI